MIPIYKPSIGKLEEELVAKAVQSGWVSSKGEFIPKFEQFFAQHVGVKYAVSVNNGTAACHLALLAHGIGEGDEVIIPNTTFVATANAVKYCGATPVIAPVRSDTWNIDLDHIDSVEALITEKTKAIFVVHLLGNPCHYNALKRFKRKYSNILIIEDACEAFGAGYKDSINDEYFPCGSWFDAAAFSFYGNKSITTGEGGMVTTNNKDTYEKLLLLKGQGQTDTYFHPMIGYNYRMTNIQAAIGCAQLKRWDEIFANKQRVFNRYLENLTNIAGWQYILDNHLHGNWMFAYYNNWSDRIPQNIYETRPMFYPLTSFPQYKKYKTDSNDIISKDLLKYVTMLPSYPDLTNDEIDLICKHVKRGSRN